MVTVLIVEDDRVYARTICNWLTQKNMNTRYVLSIGSAKNFIGNDANEVALVLCDLCMGNDNGVDLLIWMNENGYRIPFFIMTNFGKISNAVKAIKLGATDYFCKPIQTDEVFNIISGVIKRAQTLYNDDSFFHGRSIQAAKIQEYIKLVAPTDMPVLIMGASGTGKELVAKQIHALSDRADKPFISVDCGTISHELAASELFGHVKGAFTGASEDRMGYFYMANNGTLFLDEIGNLSIEVQRMLLRALLERKFRPLGSRNEISVNIRLLTATNENLGQAVFEGRFREDLFHRINEFPIITPLLMERKTDIVPLAFFFLNQANKELNRAIKGFDDEAKQKMQLYSWPGNIRELRSVVRRAVILTQKDYIISNDLNLEINKMRIPEDEYILNDEDKEKEIILKALATTKNNRTKAAELLRLSRSTFYEKLKKYLIK